MDEKPFRYEDALRVAQEAQRANAKIQEYLSKNPIENGKPFTFEDAKHVTEEVQRTNAKNQEALEAVTDAVGGDIDRVDSLEKIGKEDPEKRNLRQRMSDWTARARTKAQALRENYPTTTKNVELGLKAVIQTPYAKRFGTGARVLGAVVRSIDAEDLRQAEELAKNWGKDIRIFIDEAGKTQKLEEKIAKGRAYHQVEQAKNNKSLSRLQKQLDSLQSENKLTHVKITDELRSSHGNQIHYKLNEIASLKEKPLSLEEVLSIKASNSKNHQRFLHAASRADEFGKNYLIGTAQDKYDYLLHNAATHLGSQYFDIAKHPQRAIEFDRFAATRLLQDGFNEKEVKLAISQGAFRPLFQEGKEASHGGKLVQDSKYLAAYDHQIFSSKITNLSQTNKTAQWQSTLDTSIKEAKINPHELDQHHELKEHWNARKLEKFEQTKAEATQKLKEYRAVQGQWMDQSTDTQFMLEYGRWLEAGKNPNERVIGIRLMQAGHTKEEIMAVLKERSPNHNESWDKVAKEYEEIEYLVKNSPAYSNKLKEISHFKKENNLDSERRLDRLGLSYSAVLGVVHEENEKNLEHSQQRHQSTKSRDIKDQEIER